MSSPPGTDGDGPLPRGIRVALVAAVGALVVTGVLVRLRYLGEGPLFIDEGESAVNALSILEHGVPRDRFLGLPIYENTLVEPWPESGEYEFRDSSYSSRGFACYHGWLPLYAIALSLAAHGVRPDDLVPPVDRLEPEAERRIRAARLPSVAFAAVFLVALFLAGRELYGVDAGLSALAAGTFLPKCVWIAQQARYHSALLAAGALAAWAAWRVVRRGRRRDFALAGLCAGVLFHTSSLTLAILALACLPLAPAVLRRPGGAAGVALSVLIGTAAVVPWALAVGWFEAAAGVPAARDHVVWPDDALRYALERMPRVAAAAAALLLLGLARAAGPRLPRRIAAPVAAAFAPALFLAGWAVATYVGFHALTPAASLWMERLSHALLLPGILLGAVGVATLARAAVPGAAPALAPGLVLVVLAGTGNLLHWQRRDLSEHAAVLAAARFLLEADLDPDARVYALPSQHLNLTYLTGLPVQSVLPVRKEFLDTHPGEVVVLKTVLDPPRAPRAWLEEMLSERGLDLPPDEVERWSYVLHAHLVARKLAPRVRAVLPVAALPEPTAVSAEVLEALGRRVEETGYGRHLFGRDNPAMLGGRPPLTLAEFWPEFFYRFVEPERRTGKRLNYARRARSATAEVLPYGFAVLRCPPLPSEIVR